MIPEFKQYWITKLTDGSFKRARKQLCRPASEADPINWPLRHCCLGVAATLAGFTYDPEASWLDQEQLVELGLSDRDMRRLATANDRVEDVADYTYPAEVIEIISTLPEHPWPARYCRHYDSARELISPWIAVASAYGATGMYFMPVVYPSTLNDMPDHSWPN